MGGRNRDANPARHADLTVIGRNPASVSEALKGWRQT